MIHNLDELMQHAKSRPRCIVAVAAAEDRHVLEALQAATGEGIVDPLLVGNKLEIEEIAHAIGFSLKGIKIVDHAGDGAASARIAVSMVRAGEADILMKGGVSTGDLLKAVLDRESGLRREEQLLSHVAFFQSPYYHKLFCVTDVAMNIAPNLEEKAQIINNAVRACQLMGIETPKVAVAAAVEKVNPKMEATVHAALLKEMNLDGRIGGCVVDGPFAIDIAVNREAALHKGIGSEVAGDCDIILVPDIEAGNIFYKALNFLGGAVSAAAVMGASVPVVLTSRSDDERSKLFSIALAACLR
ncbi:bifunctional enoyl-CoA hydratase/phosphate acetyltransferase [Proteiniphilum sp. UBA1028]|jgi:phosphate butyryltransferase|uniref:bifunctional enoyl-CoA hydratase/phosphate acetyltransferase n=1 Tax=Proteiniphilum sp. UBA1028 TaxID=1947251 RepID=UPI000E89855D|nr:bifunctional enoyl-CoA hydratase/phosphate acetyltransferase [Proteiniphilum sp. UBA1028]HBG58735.1 phosphate butyryltransferase [Porphyromonadaceae bacterium]